MLEATDPDRLPNPLIRTAELLQRPVVDENGNTHVKYVIRSSSGIHYEISHTIKRAIFGQIVLSHVVSPDGQDGVFIRTDQIRAIKIYSRHQLRQLQGRTAENPLNEITALQFIGDNHPNIMGQIECCSCSLNIYSIMRYCDGDELFDYIDENGPLSNERAKDMFKQLLSGLSHLQTLGLGHRDMSLENIMYSKGEVYIIIDFGMSLKLVFNPTVRTFHPLRRQVVCGKRNYISPEVLRQDPVFNPMLSDVWALGVILFIAITGVPPVEQATTADDRYLMIADNRMMEMITAWGMHETIDPLAIDLIQQILRPNPNERLTIPQMLDHPWLQ